VAEVRLLGAPAVAKAWREGVALGAEAVLDMGAAGVVVVVVRTGRHRCMTAHYRLGERTAMAC